MGGCAARVRSHLTPLPSYNAEPLPGTLDSAPKLQAPAFLKFCLEGEAEIIKLSHLKENTPTVTAVYKVKNLRKF